MPEQTPDPADRPSDRPRDDARDDARDDELAAALAVPPLDEVTRRRLVAGALAASTQDPETPTVADGRPRQNSWIPLVAAAVVILVVVVAIFALGPGSDDSTTASRPKTTTSDAANHRATAGPPTAAPSAQDSTAAGSVAPGVSDYGDLGDLSTATARRRARALVAEPTAAPDTELATTPDPVRLLDELAGADSASPIHADGNVVGIASATVKGRRALVVVNQANGAQTAYLLVLDPCELDTL